MQEKMQHSYSYYPDSHADYKQYLINSNIPKKSDYELLDYQYDIDKFMKIFKLDDFEKVSSSFEYSAKNIISQVLLYKENFAIKYHIGGTTYDEEGNTSKEFDKIRNVTIIYNDKSEKEKNKIVKKLRKIVNVDNDSYFYTIGVNQQGYFLEKNKITLNKLDININYGHNFKDKYEELKTKIQTGTDGLFLLWGEPGTGKTTLIRKLIYDTHEDKTIIYVPSYMVSHLSQPEFIGFLKNYKNSVLVLEDAEHVVLDRVQNPENQAGVSNILNMTNGLLNDIIKVQILATFNTKRDNIDKALLREGRLKFEHEFKKLSIEETQNVLDYLNIKDYKPDDEMTLSEIYNLADHLKNKEQKSKKRTIGF